MKKYLVIFGLTLGMGTGLLNVVNASDGQVFETSTAVYDLSEGVEKVTTKTSLTGISLYSNPTNSSSTKAKIWVMSKPYSVSTSSSTELEDSIYTRSRVISGSGVTLASDSTTVKKTTFGSATAYHPNLITGIGDYGIGNHTYKLSGYKDVYHETTDKF